MCFVRKVYVPNIYVPDPPYPEIAVETISRTEYLSVLAVKGVVPYGDILDSHFTICSFKSLQIITPFLIQSAEFYTLHVDDCEEYGIWAQALASRIFRVSGIRLCLGFMPYGYHGFIITVDIDRNVRWLEPNAGFYYDFIDANPGWFTPGEWDYIPEKVFA